MNHCGMMKKLFFLVCCLLAMTDGMAQLKIRDLLKVMPDTLAPYLTENNRLDLIDFCEAGMNSEVSNSLGGKTSLNLLTDDHALLTLTASSQLDLRLLPFSEEMDSTRQVICVVNSYGNDIRESVISFYDVQWKPLENSRFLAAFDQHLMKAEWQEGPEYILNVTLGNPLDIPSNEEQEKSKEMLIKLTWCGKSFK